MGGKNQDNPSSKELTKASGPWLPLQDSYKALIPRIQQINQKNWQYGPDTQLGLTPEQQQAIQQGTQMGLAGSPYFPRATDFAGNVAAGGMMGGAPGTGFVGQIAEGGVQNPVYQNLMSNLALAEQGSGGLDYARDVAGGKFINSNPYIDDVINASVESARRGLLPSLEGRMSMAGRMGSNAEAIGQGEIAKQLGNVASGIRMGDYQSERDRQQAAGLALPSLLGQEVGTRNAAAQAVSNDVYNRINQQLGAAGQAYGQRTGDIGQALGAGGALGQNYQNQFGGLDRALGYQGVGQTNAEQMAAEANARFQYGQGAPYDRINRMLSQYGQIAGVTNPAAAGQMMANAQNRPSDFQVGLNNLLQVAGTGATIGGMFMNPAAGMGMMAQQAASRYDPYTGRGYGGV